MATLAAALPCCVVLAVAAASPTLAADLVLVRAGQPAATIVVGEKPSADAREAAKELQTHLRRITGAELPIVESPAGVAGAKVLVGQSAGREAAAAAGMEIPTGLTSQFSDEGYVVIAHGDTLVLAGNETEPYQGTYYAVSDFLQSLGCRWFFPGEFGEVAPHLDTVAVKPVRHLVRPELRVRDVWYSGHLATTGAQHEEYRIWKRRNRMCRPGFWEAPEGKYLQNPVDDSTFRLLPEARYWASHPEFYSINPGGTRNKRFVCMSNPGAIQAAADTICDYFQRQPDHHTFAFSPPDEPVLCHCPDCTRAMHGGYAGEGNGDVSDAYFRFVFQLAEKVRQRFPDRWITSMAYYNRCRPPQGVEGKHPNVLIQLASIQQCSNHSYADEGRCWSRRQYAQMLRQWAALTAGQVFYEYDPHDWSHLQRPAWRSQGIADDLRLLKSLGGWGFSNEGQMAWLSTGLNYYVHAQLAWDLKQDPAALVSDFCRPFFGPAGAPMLRYYTAVEKAHREAKVHALSGSPDDLFAILPRPLLNQCAAWLDEAARLAAEEPFRGRVAAFRGHFDRIDAFEKARAAMARGDYREGVRWGEEMGKAVARVNNTALLQDAGPWGGSLSSASIAGFAKKTLPYTDGSKGRLIAVLPAEALFRTDPASDGVVGQWYLPGTDAKAWRPIRMTSAWHNQGVVTAGDRRYSGVGWYRASLDLAEEPKGPVRLYIPHLAGSAVWVWCSGKLGGYVARSGDDPLTVDVSGLLHSGANPLVLRVQGDGGLLLPPFVFTPTDESSFPDRRVDVSAFPAQWLFRADPDGQGETRGWAKADLPEAGWQSIAVPAFWQDTPVGAYTGDAWQRVRFTIPAEARGKRLILRFDAVDEEAWVYLNGEKIGEHTTASTGETIHQIWDKSFDIPVKSARPGEENVLAVRIRNAVAAGGIWKPVRLFMLP